MKYVGIVGSTYLSDDQTYVATRLITMVLLSEAVDAPAGICVVSGGADGTDTLAEVAAEILGYPTKIFLPDNRRWEPDGFKARNILIAEKSDVLYCIRSRQSQTYGSGWTADYYEKTTGRLPYRIFV